jgi:hypothetical protein
MLSGFKGCSVCIYFLVLICDQYRLIQGFLSQSTQRSVLKLQQPTRLFSDRYESSSNRPGGSGRGGGRGGGRGAGRGGMTETVIDSVTDCMVDPMTHCMTDSITD